MEGTIQDSLNLQCLPSPPLTLYPLHGCDDSEASLKLSPMFFQHCVYSLLTVCVSPGFYFSIGGFYCLNREIRQN